MTSIQRKLWRDLLATRSQAIAIGLVIACGVGTFVMSLNTLDTLKRSRQHYYDHYRFAQVFAHFKRAPRSLLPRIEAIPGVKHVQPGIVAQVNLSVDGFPESITGQLIAIPERRTPRLNALHLREGRWIERDRGEAIISEAFAQAHRFQLNDRFSAVLNGRLQDFRIVGIAISPEFVYEVAPGGLFPDNKRFGVVWIGENELAASFDMEEAFNHLALTLNQDASEREVIRRLDLLTADYGAFGAYGRGRHVSSRFPDEDIKQLESMAWITPMIFLGVAAFLLNIVVNRLIGAQREQIASLKAFGYSRIEIGRHYLQFALVIVAGGTAAGLWIGHLLGRGMTNLYGQFYRFPTIDYTLGTKTLLLALFIAGLSGATAVFRAVRRAAALPPSVSMHPEPPAAFIVTLFERAGLQAWLSPTGRMILRQIVRRPIRALMSLTGIALAVSVLIIGNFGQDAIHYMMDFQMNRTQRQDLTLTFVEPLNGRVLHEIEHLPGVLHAEGFRTVPCRLVAAHRSYELALTGLPPGGRLSRLLDRHDRILHPPDSGGLLLSQKLAEILHLSPGDAVRVEVAEGKRPHFTARLENVIEDYTGLGAYMETSALHRRLRESDTLSGAHLQIDEAQADPLYRRLKELPALASVTNQQVAMKSFEETFGENILRMRAEK